MKACFTLLLSIFCLTAIYSQTNTLRQYQYDSLQIETDKLRYGILKPVELQQEEKYPLILTLHGAEWYGVGYTGDGSDIFPVLFDFDGPYYCFNLAHCWLNKEFHQKHPAYIVIPHIHNGLNFNNTVMGAWEEQPSVDLLNSLLDKLIANEQIDTSRIYITGHSIGGAGTLLLHDKLKIQPAVLAPVAQAASPEIVELKASSGAYNNLAMWYFYPKLESRMLGNTYNYLEQQGLCVTHLKSAGKQYQTVNKEYILNKINKRQRFFCTEYDRPYPEDGSHMVMEYVVQDTLFYKWMFKQYRIDEEAINITNLSANHQLSWTVKNPSDTVEIWYREVNDWQLLEKGVYNQNQLDLSTYLDDAKLNTGYVRVASINEEGFMYGKDELRISTISSNTISIAEASISIYPNPFSHIVRIDCEDITEVCLINQSGITVLSSKHNTLDTSYLPQGIYIAVIKTSTGIYQTKLIKK